MLNKLLLRDLTCLKLVVSEVRGFGERTVTATGAVRRELVVKKLQRFDRTCTLLKLVLHVWGKVLMLNDLI